MMESISNPGEFEISIVLACGFMLLFEHLSTVIRDAGYGFNLSSPEFVSQLVSLLHAVILGFLSCLYLLDFLRLDTWVALQCIPVGYYFYDTVLIYGKTQLYIKVKRIIPVHHLVFGISSFWLMERYPFEMSISHFAEISTPLLNLLYYFLYVYNRKINSRNDRRIYAFFSVILIAMFLIFRVMPFGYLFYNVLYVNPTDAVIAGDIGIIFALNVLWFLQLIESFLPI